MKVTPSVMNIFLFSNHFFLFSLSFRVLKHLHTQRGADKCPIHKHWSDLTLQMKSSQTDELCRFSQNIKLHFMSSWGFDGFDWKLPTFPTNLRSHSTSHAFILLEETCFNITSFVGFLKRWWKCGVSCFNLQTINCLVTKQMKSAKCNLDNVKFLFRPVI